MSFVRRFSINVLSGWVGHALRMLTSAILVPYLLLKLGSASYGVWALVGSFLAYVALLDMGLTVAIRRFAARYAALESKADQNSMMSTAVVLYFFAGLLGGLITFVAAPYVPVVMDKIPQELHHDTVMLFYVGAGLAFTRLLLLPFRGFIEGLLRYELSNLAAILGRLLYFGLVLLLLHVFQPSVVLVGVAALCSMFFELLFLLIACYRVAPDLKISPRLFSKPHIRELASFGAKTFILAICSLLIFQSPYFIITKWIGPDTTAVFAVAMMIMIMIRQTIGSMGSIFLPVFSASHALERKSEIEDRLWQGSQVCNLLNWILLVGLAIYARPLLAQWLRSKPDVAAAAYLPLMILAVGQIPQGFSYVANSALAGCGHLKWLVITQVVVAVVSLALGIVSVTFGYGLRGVALAVAGPLFFRGVLWLPWYVCHRLEVSLLPFIVRVVLRPLLAAGMTAVACFGLQQVYPPSNRASLLVSVAILALFSLALALGVGLSPGIRKRLMASVLPRLRRGG